MARPGQQSGDGGNADAAQRHTRELGEAPAVAIGVFCFLHDAGSSPEALEAQLQPLVQQLGALGFGSFFAEWDADNALRMEHLDALQHSLDAVRVEAKHQCRSRGLPPTQCVFAGVGTGGVLALASPALLRGPCLGCVSLGAAIPEGSFLLEQSHDGVRGDVLVMHGTCDETVPLAEAERSCAALDRAYPEMSVRLVPLAGAGHEPNEDALFLIYKFAASMGADLGSADAEIGGDIAPRASPVGSGDIDLADLRSHVVTWEVLHQNAAGSDSVASFAVPEGAEAVLARYPINVRGSSFELRAGRPGEVLCHFASPKPALTAEAIAARLQQRLQDPAPPGMEACVAS